MKQKWVTSICVVFLYIKTLLVHTWGRVWTTFKWLSHIAGLNKRTLTDCSYFKFVGIRPFSFLLLSLIVSFPYCQFISVGSVIKFCACSKLETCMNRRMLPLNVRYSYDTSSFYQELLQKTFVLTGTLSELISSQSNYTYWPQNYDIYVKNSSLFTSKMTQLC